MTDPATRLQVGHEELPAPQHAVCAVPEAVEGETENLVGPPVIGKAGRYVGVVVLDAPGGQVQVQGHLRGEVLGVQVVDNHLRGDAEQLAEVVDGLAERLVGGQMLQVPDVVTRDHPGVLGDGDGVLQLGPHREDLPEGGTR